MENKSRTKLNTFDNRWYNPGRSKVIRLLWYYINIFFFINPLFPINGFKLFLLRRFGAKIGRNIVIKPCVNIKYPWNLELGNNVWIGENVWIDNLAPVIIGNDVCISQGAMLLTGNHDYKKTTFDLIIGRIFIEDGVWICAKSIVCPGVKLSSHSILGVASMTSKDLESYCIYQGVPAKKIRKREVI